MSAVAALVGVTPMALYRHVDDKEHLLDLLVEAVLRELPDPDDQLSGWPQLEALARGLRAAAARHTHVFPLLLQRPAITGAEALHYGPGSGTPCGTAAFRRKNWIAVNGSSPQSPSDSWLVKRAADSSTSRASSATLTSRSCSRSYTKACPR